MSKTATGKLTASLEDYLEAILFIIGQDRVARVRDIARRVGVGMPSVTTALKALSKRKLVNYDPYQVVTLTDRGRKLARQISRRHSVLRRFLTDFLGLDGETAEANACRMEHAVDDELLERLTRFAEFAHTCPRAGDEWIEQFHEFCRQGEDINRCRDCLANAMKAFRSSRSDEDDDF